MDEELQRLLTALDAAETEWREHRQTGWVAYYQGGTSLGSGTANPFTREWREREDERDGYRRPPSHAANGSTSARNTPSYLTMSTAEPVANANMKAQIVTTMNRRANAARTRTA